MEKNRNRRNRLRDDLAELKEHLQEQYLRENTVRLELRRLRKSVRKSEKL